MDFFARGETPYAGIPQYSDAALGAGLSLLLDELAHGVMITTAEGRLLYANQPARHELARHRAICTRLGLLQACSPEGGRALQQALVKVAEGKRSLIELASPQGPGLGLAAVPLRVQAGQVPRAAFFCARAVVCDSVMLCFFARAHALTAAEEQVLGILCQGFSAPQIAKQLGVAVSTVRSHVRSLCTKTRSRGVRELVSRIAVLPPVAPPFWQQPMH